MVSLQEGERQVLDVLPFCLRGRALEWHTQLSEETQLDMALSQPRAVALLEREFRRYPLEARRQAKLVTFSFETADKMPLADYLFIQPAMFKGGRGHQLAGSSVALLAIFYKQMQSVTPYVYYEKSPKSAFSPR